MGRTSKLRRNRTHGRGKKAGRGKGKRGGRGNAGLHKHKYITYLKFMPGHFGRHGFKRPQEVVSHPTIINIRDIEEGFEILKNEGIIRKSREDLSESRLSSNEERSSEFRLSVREVRSTEGRMNTKCSSRKHSVRKHSIRDEAFEVNLKEMGVDKLLGTGTPSRPYNIIVDSASASAEGKIKEAGGDILNK